MRKINSKVIAGALLAIQIAAAMPAAAFAGEIESQAVTQEQAETEALAGEEKASSEMAQKQEAADEDTDAKYEESADEESANEESANEESANIESVDEESVDEEDTENADEQYFDKDQAAAAETVKDHNQEEKAEQGKAFDQSVTVDGVRINVKAEEGTFEDGARLSVTRFPSSGLKQVQNAPDLLGSLIAAGIFVHISLQVVLNIAVVINLIPTTGITLPFVSYGGTSILFLMAEMTVALSISKQIRYR